MFQRYTLSDEHVPPLAEGVVETLEGVGVLCQNEEMLSALEATGARVDHAAERAWFPRAMVEEFAASLRAEFDGQAGGGEAPLRPSGLPRIGGQVAQIYLDPETDEERSSNSADLITLIKFGEALHGEQGVGHALAITDVPPMVEPLESAMLMAEWASNPGAAFAWHADQIDYLVEMGDILGRKDWFGWGAICFAHPLRFDRDTADKFAARVHAGQPIGITAMPVAGASTPVTIEGFVVVACAEVIATWITGRAMDPEIGLYASMWPGTLDMGSGAVSYSSPDSMRYGCAACEFIRRWTGFTMTMGGSEYCDAKTPGLYAGLEKALKAMTISAFTGQGLGCGGGMVDEGRTLSPIQLLIDREFAQAMNNLVGEFDPSPERIAMDEILDVGLGLERSHIETDHTLAYLRDSLWLPALMGRSGWTPAQEREVVDAMRGKVRELLDSYVKPQGREDELDAMREVVERARGELL
jgi:trimethylamine--corrinoid protein Co-methyltransferase